MANGTYSKNAIAETRVQALAAEAEAFGRQDDVRRGVRSLVHPFGLETALDDRNVPQYNQLKAILIEDIKRGVLDDLRGMPPTEVKIKSIWERYLPEAPTPNETNAALYLLEDRNLTWASFLNQPEVETALRDVVAERFLEDLSGVASFVSKAEEAVAAWKVKCPAAYRQAEAATDESIRLMGRKADSPDAELALEAFKQVRLFSHCLLHGHITGRNQFSPSQDLGGQASRIVMLKTPTLELLARQNKNLYYSIAKLEVGHLDHADYGQNGKEGARELKGFLGMGPADNRNPFEVLYDRLVEETDPRSAIFQSGNLKWSANHVIAQISKEVCPLLAMDDAKLRQKQMSPEVFYGLYRLSREVRNISLESVYPLLDAGINPKEVPPDFELRFDADWMRRVNVTSPMVVSAGFTPIRHKKMAELVREVFERIPDMQQRMQEEGELRQLKIAHTCDVYVRPFVTVVKQRELTRMFRELNPKAYNEALLKAAKEVLPDKFGNVSVQEFTPQKIAVLDKEDDRTKARLRTALYVEAVKGLGQMPDAVERVEERLMSDKKYPVMVLKVAPQVRDFVPLQPNALIGKSDMVAPSDPQKLVAFEPTSYGYNERTKVEGFVLSEKHYRGLSMTNGKGVLPDEIIALQGIYTTANPEHVAQVYAHYNPLLVKQSRSMIAQITEQAGEQGIMVLKGIHRNGTACKPRGAEIDPATEVEFKGDTMGRIRTASMPKYRSVAVKQLKEIDPQNPLAEAPLYLYAPLVSDRAMRFMADSWIKMAAARAGIRADEKTMALGRKVLDKTGYYKYTSLLDDPTVPIFGMEGEKKILSVSTMQDLTHMREVERVLKAPNADVALEDVRPLPMIAPVGTIGVWITAKQPGTGKHVLRPEFEETLNLAKGRQFIIGHDSDGYNNPSVAAAAAYAATVFDRDYGVKPMYWYPPEGPGKGFDDFVEENAKRQSPDLPWRERVIKGYEVMSHLFNQQIRPLRTEISYGDITNAQGKKLHLQKFITGQRVELNQSQMELA